MTSQANRQRPAQKEMLIALGGNVPAAQGRPEELLPLALVEISRRIGPVVAQSRIYRTPAYPAGSGPDYANAACRIVTALPVAEVLDRLHGIEAEFGRIRAARWGARSLDLDLLAAGDLVLPDVATQTAWMDLPPEQQRVRAPDTLILPHPRLHERAFVLVPLADVAPDWVHPRSGTTVAAMRDALPADDLASVIAITQGL